MHTLLTGDGAAFMLVTLQTMQHSKCQSVRRKGSAATTGTDFFDTPAVAATGFFASVFALAITDGRIPSTQERRWVRFSPRAAAGKPWAAASKR